MKLKITLWRSTEVDDSIDIYIVMIYVILH